MTRWTDRIIVRSRTGSSESSPRVEAGERAERALQPRGAGATGEQTERRSGAAQERRGAILIAENEANNRRLMEQILTLAGYRCRTASNGLEAVRAFDDAERIDLALIDLSMPVLDGYQTVERIRQRPEGATLPLVAVTAHATDAHREQALRAGFTDYLSKPFRPRELVSLVERLLASSGQMTAPHADTP